MNAKYKYMATKGFPAQNLIKRLKLLNGSNNKNYKQARIMSQYWRNLWLPTVKIDNLTKTKNNLRWKQNYLQFVAKILKILRSLLMGVVLVMDWINRGQELVSIQN